MSDLERLQIRHDQEFERMGSGLCTFCRVYADELRLTLLKHGRELERAEREQVEQDEPRVPEYEAKAEGPNMSEKPAPMTPEARAMGCTCYRHRAAYTGTTSLSSAGCPLHGLCPLHGSLLEDGECLKCKAKAEVVE